MWRFDCMVYLESGKAGVLLLCSRLDMTESSYNPFGDENEQRSLPLESLGALTQLTSLTFRCNVYPDCLAPVSHLC